MVQTFKRHREEGVNRPITSTSEDNIKQVKKTILKNHRITFREVFVYKLCDAKLYSKLVNFHKKQRRADFVPVLLNKVNKDTANELLKPVIRGEETWIYGYNVETAWRRTMKCEDSSRYSSILIV